MSDEIKNANMNDSMSANHDGVRWPYHEDMRTHRMIPCVERKCSKHAHHVYAKSLENAYQRMLSEHERELRKLRKESNAYKPGITKNEANEIIREYANRAFEIGLNNTVYNSPITENDDVIRLANNTYLTDKQLRADFDDDSYNRLAIAMNKYDDADELYKNWNDSEWLQSHADADTEKRLLEGPDDKTIGFTYVNMPSPAQWADETGFNIKHYPAKALNESITDYYRRGGEQLNELSDDSIDNITWNLYKHDDGSAEAKAAHRLANMLAWSNKGINSLTILNPDMIWEHVDGDGVDNIIANITRENSHYDEIRKTAFNIVMSELENSESYTETVYSYYDLIDFNNTEIVIDNDNVILISLNNDDTRVRFDYSSWSTDAYDVRVNKTGKILKVNDEDNNEYMLYPLKKKYDTSGTVYSDGSSEHNHENMLRTLGNAIDKALAL